MEVHHESSTSCRFPSAISQSKFQKKIFKRPQAIQWQIVDKEVVDEIIFRTMNISNRITIELMARGGMRIGEVLNLRPCDIQNPKSGRSGEVVYVPQKLLIRLTDYVKDNEIGSDERIFPISYVAPWSMVKKAGKLVNIELRPHDLRRHAATYASRSGTSIEIVSKVILRHADLSTTQLYLGKVNDTEAIRWIDYTDRVVIKDGEYAPRPCYRLVRDTIKTIGLSSHRLLPVLTPQPKSSQFYACLYQY